MDKPRAYCTCKGSSIKNEYYVLLAKSYGAGIFYLTFRHFLPAVFPVVMVNFIRLINRGIVAEASLSFLGLGDPTAKSWGLILNHALSFRGIYYTEFWKWWLMSPFLSITINGAGDIDHITGDRRSPECQTITEKGYGRIHFDS